VNTLHLFTVKRWTSTVNTEVSTVWTLVFLLMNTMNVHNLCIVNTMNRCPLNVN